MNYDFKLGELFPLGEIVMTRAIADIVAENETFAKEVITSLRRHSTMDWGNLSEDDKQMNDEAIANEEGRIFSAYKTPQGKIWIIT